MTVARSAGPAAGTPEAVLGHLGDGDDLIVPLANGEPVALLDAIEAGAERFQGIRVHQMHALHERPYLHGSMREHLLHMSYFLSPITRRAFYEGGCETHRPGAGRPIPVIAEDHRRRTVQASGSAAILAMLGGSFPEAMSASDTCSSTDRSAARAATHTSWRCSAGPS